MGEQIRPFTGAEYLESLRDARNVYLYGERIKDVTTHPAFRNAARSFAMIYDRKRQAENRAVMTSEEDGETFSSYFLLPPARTCRSASRRTGGSPRGRMGYWGARPTTFRATSAAL
jgi:4-hydroxyphenylacetate 3-monooxygenase